MANETSTLKVGDEAPDFELPMQAGTQDKWKLSDHRGENVIISFVPAAFSPVCSNQLPVIEQQKANTNATMVVISADNTWTQKAWKEAQGVSYPILSDFWPHGDTAKKYGVFLDGFGLAGRAVFVVDPQGKIAYISVGEILQIPDYDPALACAQG
jgi:peroxiredoxin (alkyl hydroperoxide reductase subunit C)